MLKNEENDLLTRTDPGTPCGELMRRYWQPAALSEELPPGGGPIPVRLLGEDLVLFRDEQGQLGLLGIQQQDLCATEGAGPIQDRTQEHLVASDAPIVTSRKLLAAAIKEVQEGRDPPGVFRDPARNSFGSVVTTYGDLPERTGWKEYCRGLVAEGRGWVGRPRGNG